MNKTSWRVVQAMLVFALIVASCAPVEGQVKSERTLVNLPERVSLEVAADLAADGSVLNCDYELPGVGDQYKDGVTWTLWLRRGDELIETAVSGKESGFSTLPEEEGCPRIESVAMSMVYFQTVTSEWWNDCVETGSGIVECAVDKEVEQ